MMKTNKRSSWRSQLPKFWKTAKKYRKLLISLGVWLVIFLWIGIYFFPFQHTTDILLPPGFFKSDIKIIELPNMENAVYIYTPPKSSFPVEVAAYLDKRNELIRGYTRLFQNTVTDATLSQLSRHTNLFPVISCKKERSVLVRAIKDKGYVVSLFDENFNELDQKDIYGSYFQYFVSVKFKDRLWIQTGDGSINGSLNLFEVRILWDRLRVKLISQGDEDYNGYHTYKIINPTTNPQIVVHRKAFSLFSILIFPYWLFACFQGQGIVGLILSIMLLFLCIFVISYHKFHQKIKMHICLIFKAFYGLLSKRLKV